MIKLFAVAVAATALIAAPAFAQDNTMGSSSSMSSSAPMKHKTTHKKHMKKSSMSNSMGANNMM